MQICYTPCQHASRCPVALDQRMLGTITISLFSYLYVLDITNCAVFCNGCNCSCLELEINYFLIDGVLRYPEVTSAGSAMLEHIYFEKNNKRTHPCVQSRTDAFRVIHYDVATAAEYTTHTQPLLSKRHNVVPGMFLVSRQISLDTARFTKICPRTYNI